MALTKTQIYYLEGKLNRVIDDRVAEFEKELGQRKDVAKTILEKVKSGEIKILSPEKIVEVFERKTASYYYCNPSFSIEELVNEEDANKVKNEVDKRDDKINEFRDKLRKAKQNALDKIVLEGVDVETAITELNNIK